MSFNEEFVNNLNELVINVPSIENNQLELNFNDLHISNNNGLEIENNIVEDSSKYLKVNKKKEIYAVKEVLKQVSKNQYQIKWSDNSITTCKINDISPYTISLFNIMVNHNRSINNPVNKKAFIYIRESQNNKKKFTESTSRNNQQYSCLKFCKENNIHVQYIAEDIGVSGRNMKNLEKGELKIYKNYINESNIMILHSIDRLGRHAGKALCFLDEMMERNIDVYFVLENFIYNKNTTSLQKQALSTNLVSIENYSNQESEKLKKINQEKRNKGEYIGMVPYGYKIIKKDGIRIKVKDNNKFAIIRNILIKYKEELSKNTKINKFQIYKRISKIFIVQDIKLTRTLIKRIIEKRLKNIDYQNIRI